MNDEVDYPHCRNCKDIYGLALDHLKAPKVMDCGHSICKECLEKIINENFGKKFICPFCFSEIKKKKNIDDYITNIETIEELKRSFNLVIHINDDEVTKFNIIALGKSGVGKTSIIQRFSNDKFSGDYLPTIGFDYSTKYIKFRKNIYQLNFYDTAGQEKYRSLAPSFIKQADGVLFIYDVTKKDSFYDLEYWYKLYNNEKKEENIGGLLIGNKCDCEREVNVEEAIKFSKEHDLKYLETSAILDKNIKKAMVLILEEIIESRRRFSSISSNCSSSSYNTLTTNSRLERKNFKKRGCKC